MSDDKGEKDKKREPKKQTLDQQLSESRPTEKPRPFKYRRGGGRGRRRLA